MKQLTPCLIATSLLLTVPAFAADTTALLTAAKAEGEVNSVGMPDSWANWKDTWADLGRLYGLKHVDTDKS